MMELVKDFFDALVCEDGFDEAMFDEDLLKEAHWFNATRNMFYDEQRKHVRTKKEILDENGNVRKGCKISKKGGVYERNLFTAKNKLFRQEKFLNLDFLGNLGHSIVKHKREDIYYFDNCKLIKL